MSAEVVSETVPQEAVHENADACVWESDGLRCGAPVGWRLVTHCCGRGVFPLCDMHAGAQETLLREHEQVHFDCETDITSWTWFPAVTG